MTKSPLPQNPIVGTLMIMSDGRICVLPTATEHQLRETLTLLAEAYYRDVLWPRQMARRMA